MDLYKLLEFISQIFTNIKTHLLHLLYSHNKKVNIEEIWTNEFKPFLKNLNVDEYKGDGIDYDIFEWN